MASRSDDELESSKSARRHELDAMDTSTLQRSANWFVLLSGAANVVMQLSNRPVGYGVMESKYDDGNLFKNPRRRARTTLNYLAVAYFGTGEERAALRAATNHSHAHVQSDADSPVEYNAFDPTLQKWVAACLYQGAEEAYELVHGPLRGKQAFEFYGQGKVFGTTLQMPVEAWPPTRADFDDYWRTTTASLQLDDTTREFLMRVIRLEYLGRKIPARVLRFRMRITAGHLGPEFRSLMNLEWTDEDQRKFERYQRRLARVMRVAPRFVREAPFRRRMRDIRKRMAAGAPLF